MKFSPVAGFHACQISDTGLEVVTCSRFLYPPRRRARLAPRGKSSSNFTDSSLAQAQAEQDGLWTVGGRGARKSPEFWCQKLLLHLNCVILDTE